ncbi:hypothetical protein [Streptomyces cinnamoneus]|uniref:hypothetical protein n=1 Tax=Streptomyces cinnamoneus TaxID=53446 RepID=UPI00378BCCCB
MPLPFLTADRDSDDLATTTAAPLPHEDPYESRDRWRRPYRPGPARVGGAALLLLLAAYVLCSAAIVAVAGSLPATGVCVAVAALLITLAVRLVRLGIWVGPRGLRQSGLLSGTTLPWSEVAEVRTVQQPVRLLGTPRTVQGQALVVRRTQGEPLAVLVTDHNADFVGRPMAFAMAADAIEDWVAELRH